MLLGSAHGGAPLQDPACDRCRDQGSDDRAAAGRAEPAGLPQFQGKAFAGRAIAYPIALAIVPVVWLLLRRPIPYPVVPDILIGLPFLIDMVGNALGLYDSVEWWDDANHLVNWWLHTAAIAILLAGTDLARAARPGSGSRGRRRRRSSGSWPST